MQLRILLDESWDLRGFQNFKENLEKLGIEVTELRPQSRQEFFKLRATKRYEMTASEQNSNHQETTEPEFKCLEQAWTTMRSESPMSERHHWAAQAIARAQQAAFLNIFVGEARNHQYFIKQNLIVPAGLSVERTHLYGFELIF